MKIERLLEYARHRQILEVRIVRDINDRHPCRLLPLGLVTPEADKPPADRKKKPYVLAISWDSGTAGPRFEHIGDDQLLPLHRGDKHTELDPDEALPLPWWTDNIAELKAKHGGALSDAGVLTIGRTVTTQLALLEAIAALVLTGGSSRFQYARGSQDENRGGQLVGTGGKHGHLLYILDDDRRNDANEPMLRSFKHGNIRGLLADVATLPTWDGEWKTREVSGG